MKLSIHDALSSLHMGLLPIQAFSGQTGAQYRNPDDPELRLDFVTPSVRKHSYVSLPHLGLVLECLKFIEYLIEQPTQASILSPEGATLVNIPDPARYAVHKLIVYAERPLAEKNKAAKDIEQAAALIACLYEGQRGESFKKAWKNAYQRGKGWQERLKKGRRALLSRHPDLHPCLPK